MSTVNYPRAFAFLALAGGIAGGSKHVANIPSTLSVTLAGIFALLSVHELLGRPIHILRWSVLRMGLGFRNLMVNWQVGDGREARVLAFVKANAPRGGNRM